MKKVGRPRKEHPKNCRIQVYFTEEEFNEIRVYVTNHNTSASELLHKTYSEFVQTKSKEKTLERIKNTYHPRSGPPKVRWVPIYFSEEEYYSITQTAIDLDISESGLIRRVYQAMRSEVLA